MREYASVHLPHAYSAEASRLISRLREARTDSERRATSLRAVAVAPPWPAGEADAEGEEGGLGGQAGVTDGSMASRRQERADDHYT